MVQYPAMLHNVIVSGQIIKLSQMSSVLNKEMTGVNKNWCPRLRLQTDSSTCLHDVHIFGVKMCNEVDDGSPTVFQPIMS